MSLPKELFSVEKNEEVVHQTLTWLLASRRQGTHSTLTRAEVSGSGKKPWKQKGTGRARAGSIRSPLWRTGGVTFGPKPRDYSFALPKKVRNLALKVVLSDRAREDKVQVVDEVSVSDPKTKTMLGTLKKLKIDGKKAIIIVDELSKNLELASRNIPGLTVVKDCNLNIYDLLGAENVVLTKKAVAGLKERLA